MPLLVEVLDDLGADPAVSTDDDDLHACLPVGGSGCADGALGPLRRWCAVGPSVEGEEPVGLRDGAGEAVSADHPGAIAAGLDPQHQVAVLQAREADHAAA